MENASKALIIAGAILLSILIIGLGMFIYNQAASQVQDTGLDSEKVKAYNSKFLAYEGTKVSGTEVKTLISTVTAHNSTAADYTEFIKVQMKSAARLTSNGAKATTTAATLNRTINGATIKGAIVNGKTYTVDFGYDASGRIVAVGIVVNP